MIFTVKHLRRPFSSLGREQSQRSWVGTNLLAPSHTVSEAVDKVLTVALKQVVLHYLVDHLFGALDDLVHGQWQVGAVQFVVHLPGAAMQHILQPAVFDHCLVAEDGRDAAHLEILTWGPEETQTSGNCKEREVREQIPGFSIKEVLGAISSMVSCRFPASN